MYFGPNPSLLLVSEMVYCSVIVHNQQNIMSRKEKVENAINTTWQEGGHINMKEPKYDCYNIEFYETVEIH